MKVFIHTWKINDWERVLQEQMDSIIDSGLSKVAEVEVYDGDGEDKTFARLWNYSQTNDDYVLYLHNLGITWQGTKYEEMTEKYRRWVMAGVVDDWKNYSSHLENYDVVGDNYKPDMRLRMGLYRRHFATNNWWVRTDYIRTLQKPVNLSKGPWNRKDIEVWVCRGDGRFKEIRKNHDIEPHEAYQSPRMKNMPR